jgi:hypothetical protein
LGKGVDELLKKKDEAAAAEAKAEPTPEVKPKPKVEATTEPKPEAKTEPKPEAPKPETVSA